MRIFNPLFYRLKTQDSLNLTYFAKLRSISSFWLSSLGFNLTINAVASVLSSKESPGLLRSIRRLSSSSEISLPTVCLTLIEQLVVWSHGVTALFPFSFLFFWSYLQEEKAKLNAWATVSEAAWAYGVNVKKMRIWSRWY